MARQDPIKRALQLYEICSTLAKSVKSMSDRITAVQDSLRDFVIKMLDLCEGCTDARVFLYQVQPHLQLGFYKKSLHTMLIISIGVPVTIQG